MALNAGRWKVEITRDISTLAPHDWDAILDKDDLQASHAFIQACQDSWGITDSFWMLTVRDGSDLICTAVFFRMDVLLDLLAPRWTRSVLRGARRCKPSFLKWPVLFCGLPVSFGKSCLRMRPDAPAADLIGIVVGAMRQIVAEEKIELLCFKEFDDAEVSQYQCLAGHGFFPVPSLPGCTLALPWSTIDQYIEAMRAGYRRQVQQTLQYREDHGLQVRRSTDLSPVLPRVYELYARVMNRAEHQLERLPPTFFHELFVRLTGRCRVLLIEQEERVVAFAVTIQGAQLATFLLTGFDERCCTGGQLYANVVLFVIEDAMVHGAQRLELGQTSYPLKTRLGGCLSPRTIFLSTTSSWRKGLLKSAAPLLFPGVEHPPRRVFRENGLSQSTTSA